MSGLPTAMFVLEASHSIGGGHFQRCLALRSSLTRHFKSQFAVNKTAAAMLPDLLHATALLFDDGRAGDFLSGLASSKTKPALLILDNYRITAEHTSALAAQGVDILFIDDLADRPMRAQTLVNSSPNANAIAYRQLTGPDCKLLLGPDYALLRPEFRRGRENYQPSLQPANRPKLLISFGLTDPGDATSMVLDEISSLSQAIDVTALLGADAPHKKRVADKIKALEGNAELILAADDMAALYCTHDLAIGAPATSALERACSGVASLIILTAENQRSLAAALAESGAADLLGEIDSLEKGQVAKEISLLSRDQSRRNRMQRCGRRMVDGLGAPRVAANILLGLRAKNGNQLLGRRLRPTDSEAILCWQSAPGARRYSRNPMPPDRATHESWMKARLAQEDAYTEIIERNGKPVAMVRLDPSSGGVFEVSLIVSPEASRQGIGSAALTYIDALMPDLRKVAWIHEANSVSRNLFIKCGYGRNPGRELRLLDRPWEAPQ